MLVGEIGGNDYNYAFAMNSPQPNGGLNNIGRMITGAVESLALVPLVVKSITGAAKELLDMGATRMVIPGNFPLGCVPSYLEAVNETDRAAYDGNGFLVVLNLFAQMHNVLLLQGIRELRQLYPSTTIAYADYYAAHLAVMRSPARYGFAEPFKTCCGSGGGAYNFEIFSTCGSPEVPAACAHPARYVNWDGVHMTEAMYKVVAGMFFRDASGTFIRPSFGSLLAAARKGHGN